MWKTTLSSLVLGACTLPAAAAAIQVGDFRLSTNDVSALTYYDPGFSGFTTRAVAGAPEQVNSAFSGTSQNTGGTTPDTDDIGLKTFSSATQIRQLSRFTSKAVDSNQSVQRAGAVQWSFDLAPLDNYVTTTGQSLTAIDLDLVLAASDTNMLYDVYLSYTSAAAGTTLTGIPAPGGDVYTAFFEPASTASVGDIVGGKFEVLAQDASGNQTISDSLLTLYNDGVRDFNLIFASGDFGSSRTFNVEAGSGLSITAIPEPASAALVGVGLIALLGRRR